MIISRTLAIILKTAEAGRGPELIRTSMVMRIFFDRPVAGSATVGAWQDAPSKIDGINVGHMVIEEMREMASDEANFSADNYPGPVKQIAREIRRAWAENNAKPVEERESCQIPGCQCNGRADYMDWSSDDMTETDYSDYDGN